MTTPKADDILRVEHISKRYGAVTALVDVNLRLEQGEVLGLIGDNGAGKSTLIKIICGIQRADPAQRRGGAPHLGDASPLARHRRGLPGPGAGPSADRVPEHVPEPGAGALAAAAQQEHAEGGQGA